MAEPTRVLWFLTGSQGLYGDDVLGQVADQSRTVSDALDASAAVPFPVVAKPVLTDAGAIRRTMLEANSDDGCIGVEVADASAATAGDHVTFVTVDDAGHFLHLERPDEVNDHIIGFVS